MEAKDEASLLSFREAIIQVEPYEHLILLHNHTIHIFGLGLLDTCIFVSRQSTMLHVMIPVPLWSFDLLLSFHTHSVNVAQRERRVSQQY